MTAPTTHCQICGRAIRTVFTYGALGSPAESDTKAGKTDRIAHHGYKRPWKQGWQTGSCFGAKWRPYEVASDALPPAIKGGEEYIASQKMGLAKFIAAPPATLRHNCARHSYDKPILVDVAKPDNFDPTRPDYRAGSYVSVYLVDKHGYEQNIKHAEHELLTFRKRLANWYPQPAQVVA